MHKEIIITLVIVILVIIGNVITQNNTNKSVEEMNDHLLSLKEEIGKDIVNQEQAKDKMQTIKGTWEEKSETMAYYIEHNELEKVETELAKLGADIETEEYAMAAENLDNCVFILEHIKDKSALKIVNIF